MDNLSVFFGFACGVGAVLIISGFIKDYPKEKKKISVIDWIDRVQNEIDQSIGGI